MFTDEQKRKTRYLTKKAVKSGEIKKTSCEMCGEVKVDAHHPNYADHLNVRWLCRKHHRHQHPEHPKHMVKMRWRKEYGIRFRIFIKPVLDKILAKLECEGEVFNALGRTHTEAMTNVTNLFVEKKLSLEK